MTEDKNERHWYDSFKTLRSIAHAYHGIADTANNIGVVGARVAKIGCITLVLGCGVLTVIDIQLNSGNIRQFWEEFASGTLGYDCSPINEGETFLGVMRTDFGWDPLTGRYPVAVITPGLIWPHSEVAQDVGDIINTKRFDQVPADQSLACIAE